MSVPFSNLGGVILKKCKRILCFLFAALLSFVNFIPVYASEGGGGSSGGAGASQAISYGLLNIGIAPSPDAIRKVAESSAMADYVANGVPYTTSEKDGKTYMSFDSDFWHALYDTAMDTMQTDIGYSYYGSTVTLERILNLYSLSPDMYKYYSDLLSGTNVFLLNPTYLKQYATLDSKKYYYYFYYSSSTATKPTAIYRYDPVTKTESKGGDGFYLNTAGPPTSNSAVGKFNISDVWGCYCPDLLVFNNLNSLNKYLVGSPAAYIGSRAYNFNPDINISINKEVYETYDWSTVNNSTYQTINNTVSESSGESYITPEEIQTIVDTNINKILDALDSVNENLDDVLHNLDALIAQITASGQNQSAWLAKIYTLLSERLDGSGSGGSGGDITFPPDLSEKLDAILAELVLSNTKLDSIIDNMGALEDAIEQNGGTDNFILGIFNKFQDVGKEAQQRFPTSIPWDLMITFKKLAATPETPHFEFHIKVERFGIDVPLKLDLEQFASLSKASRAFLSLTFLLYLMTLTRKLFLDGGGAKNVG